MGYTIQLQPQLLITLDSMDDFREAIERNTIPLDGETYEQAWTHSYNVCWDTGAVTVRKDFVKSGWPLTIRLKDFQS